jgi:hypothetical protein
MKTNILSMSIAVIIVLTMVISIGGSVYFILVQFLSQFQN